MNNRLIEICSLLNIPQATVSHVCGIGRPTVNEWFTQKRVIPKRHLETLSVFYGISIESLTKEEPLTTPEKIRVFEQYIQKRIGQEVHIRIRRQSPHNPA